MRAFAFSLVIAALCSLCGSALGHALGFSTAELRFEDGQYQIEWVLDAPSDEPVAAADQRRRVLVDQVRGALGVRFEPGAQPAEQRVKVLALGEGPNAVDVVAIRGSVPPGAVRARVDVASEAGDVALEVRTLSGASGFAGLVAAGEQSPWVELAATSPADSPQGVGTGAATAAVVESASKSFVHTPQTSQPAAPGGGGMTASFQYLAFLFITLLGAANAADARREQLACLLGALAGWGVLTSMGASLASPVVEVGLGVVVGSPWAVRRFLPATNVRGALTATASVFGWGVGCALSTTPAFGAAGWVNGVVAIAIASALMLGCTSPAVWLKIAAGAKRPVTVAGLWGAAMLWGVARFVLQ